MSTCCEAASKGALWAPHGRTPNSFCRLGKFRKWGTQTRKLTPSPPAHTTCKHLPDIFLCVLYLKQLTSYKFNTELFGVKIFISKEVWKDRYQNAHGTLQVISVQCNYSWPFHIYCFFLQKFFVSLAPFTKCYGECT